MQTVVDDEEETFITQYSNEEEDEGEREEREEDSKESDIESTQILDHSFKDRSVITSPGEPKKPNKVSELQLARNKRKADDKTKTGNLNRNSKRGKSSKSDYLDDMEVSLIRDIGKAVKGESKEKPQDDVDVYVKSLAADLRQFQQREYFMAKHEIQCIIFKYQMAKYHQSTPTRPTANKENVSNEMHQQQGAYQSWINN